MATKHLQPLVAVIGATGTGKSELAVALARRFNGEIINGDAMQLYDGLPIITNKISTEERQGIPHHLLGCIGFHEPTWVVGTFVNRAQSVIEDLHIRGKLPILVGGTNYYTQSLLFSEGLASSRAQEPDDGPPVECNLAQTHLELLQRPTDVLLAELRNIDPVMADRWHPNDRRKIQRSLEIYLRSGRKASDVYAEQRIRKESQYLDQTDTTTAVLENSDAPGIRYPFLIFWVDAETEVLRSRLDSRVERMMQHGLINEVDSLNEYLRRQSSDGETVDETRGIWVSIGYKEFKDYCNSRTAGSVPEKIVQQMKEDAVEKTQIATRQYAKRQIRWIRIKLVNALAQANATDRLFILDSTDPSGFDKLVIQPAIEVTERFLTGSELPAPASVCPSRANQLRPRRDFDMSAEPEKWQKHHCEVCDVTCVTPDQWEQHTRSKAHKKNSSKARSRRRESQSLDSQPLPS